jgi:hypothetical protein
MLCALNMSVLNMFVPIEQESCLRLTARTASTLLPIRSCDLHVAHIAHLGSITARNVGCQWFFLFLNMCGDISFTHIGLEPRVRLVLAIISARATTRKVSVLRN